MLICCSNVDSCFLSDGLFFDFVVLFLVILFIVHRRLCQTLDDHFFRFAILVDLSFSFGLQRSWSNNVNSVAHAEFCFREISDIPGSDSGGRCGDRRVPLNPDFYPCLSILKFHAIFCFSRNSQSLIGVFFIVEFFGLFRFSLLLEFGVKLLVYLYEF